MLQWYRRKITKDWKIKYHWAQQMSYWIIYWSREQNLSEKACSLGFMKWDPIKIMLKSHLVVRHGGCLSHFSLRLSRNWREWISWVWSRSQNSFVSMFKWCQSNNGDIRICTDLKQLNEVIILEKYVLPTLNDSLDIASGFWQIPLHVSKSLTIFITAFTQYCFCHLPFGITSASEIFQKRVKGACCFMDDILIFGLIQEEHDHKLCEVLQTIQA